MNYPVKSKMERIATVLLEIGSLMMVSGANTERIRVTLLRIASTWGYNIELMITHKALLLTVMDENGESTLSKIRHIGPHTVNFSIVSDISHMSWNISEGNWSVEEVVDEVERLKKTPSFNRWLVLFMAGCSDAAFCFLLDGGYIAMIISFIATAIGLFVKQESVKKNMNSFVVVFLSSLAASLVSQIAYFIPYCTSPDAAFATAVLFLIPGVPLVNSITDLIDGNIQNSIARGVNGFLISFAIALGLMVAKICYSLFL